jgi:antibiotic biosynthesis monooxygenase (ABM) superfamily enzyme
MTTLSANSPLALNMEIAPKAASPAGAPPKPIRWRQALLMALAVYPIITAYIYVLFPLTEGWEVWQRTLVLVPMMVLSIVYFIAPNLQRHLGWFIVGKKRK